MIDTGKRGPGTVAPSPIVKVNYANHLVYSVFEIVSIGVVVYEAEISV